MPAAEGQAIAWLWIMKFIGGPPESSPSWRAPGSRLGQGWAGRADRQSSNAAQERARDREPAGPRERPAGDRSIAGEAAESGSLVDTLPQPQDIPFLSPRNDRYIMTMRSRLSPAGRPA